MKNEARYLLVKECYELGLRVVGMILEMWQTAGEAFLEGIFDLVLSKEDNIESKEELERLLNQFIFFFCESASFNMIKRISHAVGTKDLSDIYDRLLEDNQTNAYKLVDLSVKLDSIGFPKNVIYDLNDTFKDNVFCSRILSHLVLHHFYLFHTTDKVKQQVCDKLGIKVQYRGVDAQTESQKRLPPEYAAVMALKIADEKWTSEFDQMRDRAKRSELMICPGQ